MTDLAPGQIAVFGADHAALALSLARVGYRIVLVEPDPHDRTRLGDMITRAGAVAPDHFSLACEEGDWSGADVVLCAGPDLSKVERSGCVVLSLDWRDTGVTALHLTELPGHRRLLECLGSDPGGHGRAIGRALDARVIRLPAGPVPPSQRLSAVLSAEIEALALTGAAPAELDDALAAAGFEPGPFEAQDIAGIDTCLVSRRAVFARLSGPPELPLFARAVAEGRLGRKVGVGWYRYPGGGGKVEDPLVEDMAIEEARFAGLARASLDDATLRARVIAVLREEAARIVRDGQLSADAVDEIAQLSVGAPPDLIL